MLLRVFTTALAGIALSGCVATTDFADQSNAYNVEAKNSNDQQLLLNIVRSSYSAPTEFSTVQTATGTSMLSGSLSLTSALSSIATPTGMASTNGSLASAISNTVLDTREFYSGMRSAIPATVINEYFQENYSRAVIFNLFFDRIILWSNSEPCKRMRHYYRCEYSFNNNPRDARQFALFQTMMRYLLGLGFTTETVKTLPADPKKPDDNKAPDSARFCFRPRTEPDNANVGDLGAQCNPAAVTYWPHITTPPKTGLGIRLDQSIRDDIVKAASDNPLVGSHDFDDETSHLAESLDWMRQHGKVSVALRVRSPLSVIEYLGSLVAAYRIHHTFPLVDKENPHEMGPERRKDFTSCAPPGESCMPLFQVYNDIVDPTGISVSFNGLQHTIPGDATKAKSTYYIMSIVRQLIALSLSAKDLPAPAVLTLVP